MRANTSGSCLRNHSSFGAVNPGIARLPVIARKSARLSSSAHSASLRPSFHRIAGRSTWPRESSSVAPCICPLSPIASIAAGAISSCTSCSNSWSIALSVACHHCSGSCSDQRGCGCDTLNGASTLARNAPSRSSSTALTAEVPRSMPTNISRTPCAAGRASSSPSTVDEAVDQILQPLLLAADVMRVETLRQCLLADAGQAAGTGQDALAQLATPAGVTARLELAEQVALDHVGGAQQRHRQHVHRADVAMEQVGRAAALAAHLGVEVHAALAEAAGLEDLVQHQRAFLHAVRELVGVPAVLRITAVRVDAAEYAQRDCGGDLMVKRVPGQGGVVAFDIGLDLAFQPEVLEEAGDRGDVVVVLVLGRLLRLRLDQDVTVEAEFVLVL